MIKKFKAAAQAATEKIADKFHKPTLSFGTTLGAVCAASKYVSGDESLLVCLSYGLWMGVASSSIIHEIEKAGRGVVFSVLKGGALATTASLVFIFGSVYGHYVVVDPTITQIKNNAITAQAAQMPWREGQQFRVNGFFNDKDVVTIQKITNTVDPLTNRIAHQATLDVKTYQTNLTKKNDEPVEYRLMSRPRPGEYVRPAP